MAGQRQLLLLLHRFGSCECCSAWIGGHTDQAGCVSWRQGKEEEGTKRKVPSLNLNKGLCGVESGVCKINSLIADIAHTVDCDLAMVMSDDCRNQSVFLMQIFSCGLVMYGRT